MDGNSSISSSDSTSSLYSSVYKYFLDKLLDASASCGMEKIKLLSLELYETDPQKDYFITSRHLESLHAAVHDAIKAASEVNIYPSNR